jgi:hypothetical protein
MASIGGVARRELFLGHQALDVFQHHDRVVDHDADCQHHGEQGQGVDREAEQPQAGKGADQRNRHGHHRDQRGAPALQEHVDHGEHQHHRFDQGLDHFVDRGLTKRVVSKGMT